MKKVFLLLTMLLFAFTSVMRADVVEIGEGTGTTYYFPIDNYFNYSVTEQIYTADEIGMAGTINSISFYYNYGTAYTAADVTMYMKNVERSVFASTSDCEALSEDDIVWYGTIAPTEAGWYTFTLDTPFEYDGTNNLLVAFYDGTTGYPGTSYTWRQTTSPESAYMSLRYYSDSTNPNPYELSSYTGSKQWYTYRLNAQIDITAGGGGEAGSLTVHDGTTTNSYVPVYGFYADAYLKAEFVYPAAELSTMAGATINTMTFYASESSVNWGTPNFQVFVTEVADATISAFAGPGTVVYEGALSIVDGEMVVNFTTPYTYNGGNMLVGVYLTNNATYVTSTWLGETVTGASFQGYNYSSLTAVAGSQRNFLPKTTFDYVSEPAPENPEITYTPDPIDLGYRPNGAWMAPFVVELGYTSASPVEVSAVGTQNNFFAAYGDVPFTLSKTITNEVEITTTTAEAGEQEGSLVLLYTENREAAIIPMTAIAYDPEEGDVYETAVEVNLNEVEVVETANLPEILYKNYELPFETENVDAVYKLNIGQDALLYAGVQDDEDAYAFLYTEDFEGVGGPSYDNYYTYNGPTINPGPTNLWFYYPYTGTNTWYGTAAGGGYYFGYKISTDEIAANDLAGLTITQVEAAAREAYPYYCYIIEGGDTPFDGNMIGGGSIENPEPLYFFDINLNMPAYISGNSDIWVIFYSDSPYAAYCGKNPSDVNNGKIWTYNPNASSPAWTSNVTYTPVIYARMLELPTGREVTMDLAKMEVKKGNGVESEIVEVEGNVMNVAKANMRNRDVETLTVHDGSATNGNVPVYGFYADAYLKCEMVYPAAELADMAGATISSMKFYASQESVNWGTPNFQVFVTEVADATISAFAGPGTVVYEGALSIAGNEMVVNFTTPYTYNGGNLLVGFYLTNKATYVTSTWLGETVDGASVQGYSYSSLTEVSPTQRNFLPKTTFTYEGGDTPEPPTPEPWSPDFTTQIDGMFVPAGTYYLVVSSSVVGAEVDFAIAEVPAPVQAIVWSPADGEGNVVAPYLAEWTLGDYTAQMQVLLGTQYPPQTVLVDWTDYLVEQMFLTNLEPNQTYFLQVNEKNAAGDITEGEIVAFTTPLDGVNGFAVEEANLYPGDAAVFTWEANRALIGYNLYKDGELVNVEGPITATTYTVEDLEYNMDGYAFQLKAVYGAGESDPTEPIIVKMTGTATVSGYVYDAPEYDPEDPDQSHPVAGLPITFIVRDEYTQTQTYADYVTTDENGFYTAEVLAGMCIVGISDDTGMAYGYAAAIYYDPATSMPYVMLEYDNTYENINIYTHEYYYPLGMITATEQVDENNVLVEWSWDPAELIVDFETGDFSQADFTLPAQYPWTITTTNPHEGTYCMKSTCEGIASGVSSIEATVEVPYYAKMGFWVKVSSESNYDKFHFYIDGVEQGQALSGALEYQYKEYTVEEGTHTYKWEYAKDSSVNSNDDCVYVDDITMYMQDVPPQPIPGATVYNFDDDTMMGWTSIDADGDGNGWVSSANPGIYHNSGVNLSGTGHNASEAYVISGSYANQTGAALTPDNYLVAPTAISAQDGAAIEFYACAQDANYAAEHFGVAVSTTTASAGAFTTIQEWTLTAKSKGTVDMRSDVRGTRDQGAWYMYTVDLSAYAGQDIWVAIRHFNCTDQFILNVDDITLGDGSAKVMPRGNREFASYNLYRRDVKNGEEEAEIITVMEGIPGDVMSYIDNDWADFGYGMYQWGIQATYEGYAPEPERSREVYTYTFDSGLEGWTNIDADGDGNVWYNSTNSLTYSCYDYSTLGHNGTGCFMISQSYTDCTYDSYAANNFLVSPQKYPIDANSSITFWQDWANDSYPDFYEVMVSTAANPGANDFTSIWSVGSKGNTGDGAKIRNTNNRYENWTEYNVSLAAYAGQEVWIAFHHEDYDNYELWLDDVTVTAAGSAPVPPTPVPTGNGLSEIIWSNILDKDMVANVIFNVALNNGQDPTGVVLTIEGEDTYTRTVDETGIVELALRKGTYDITATMEGYDEYTETYLFELDEEVYNIVLMEQILPVSDFYVSPTGWAKWEGGIPGPTPGPTPGDDSFTEDFEGGLNGWNVLTVNADGGEWLHSSDNPSGYDYTELAHGGTGFAMCYSYVDYVGAYNTDSYMYTPQMYNINNGSTLSFWADNANDSYPENFSVCVSTAANPTSAADFTQVWSGGAKGNGNGGAAVRHMNNRYQNWRSHSIDLSAYAGQSVWIAFHDVNYDAYEIWIDDVELGVANKGDRAPMSYKVFLEGAFVGETEYPFFQVPVEGLTEGEEYTVAVAPLYATGMGETMYATFEYAACDNYTGATEYAATVNGNDVTLTWVLPDTPGPGPGPGPQPGPEETFDFDDSTLQGWTTIDGGSPSGYGWTLGSAKLGTGYGHNGTADLVLSQSYDNNYGVIYPDNYLISPAKAQYTSISLWACGQDASYAAEHFGIAVSTGGATASEFVMVNEWTIGSKGERYDGPRGARAQSTWTQYTADLSAYAGQDIWVAVRHFNCSDMFYLDVDDITLTTAAKGNRDMWDLVGTIAGTSAGQQAVATDGNYIYTASWQTTPTGGYTFYKYDLQGNFVEGFDIAGATGIRDLTFDGDYFYGTSGGANIFILDLTNKTLVGTINCSGLTSRHISYDPERDGFWSGNWSTLALYSRTGALIQNGPAPTSAYGSAYYKDADGVEHLFLFCQPNSDCMVYDYNITTGTLGTNVVLDFSSTTPGCTGIAGGSFIGNYGDKLCWFGNSQQDPNLIGIYELESNPGPGPGPGPQPTPGDVLGVIVLRDGEVLVEDGLIQTGSTYTYTDYEAGEHEYCIRVVYSDYAMACAQCETVVIGDTPSCDPVTNLTAEPYTYEGNDGALVQFTEPAGATSYKVYVDGQLLGSIAGQPIFINFEGSGDGNYEIGIVAVYAECESDMATVMFAWDAIAENDIVNAIYPNPTSNDLHINATAMKHVCVYNAMGQMVLDQEVSGDEVVLNMGQFEAGVYMVKVTTETGSSVKRITVTK